MDSVEFNGYNIVWFMDNLKNKNAKFNIDIFMGIMIVIFSFWLVMDNCYGKWLSILWRTWTSQYDCIWSRMMSQDEGSQRIWSVFLETKTGDCIPIYGHFKGEKGEFSGGSTRELLDGMIQRKKTWDDPIKTRSSNRGETWNDRL